MQYLTYDIKSGNSITLWRGIEAQIGFYNFDSLEGDWKFLVDCDWIDGVILSGATQIVSDKLIVTLNEMNTKELAFAIQGKENLKCKATLTDLSENVIIIQMNVKNRAIQSEPKPIQAYYTKHESDSRFAPLTGLTNLNEIVSADVSNLANNYWTKQETAAAIANVQTMDIIVVQELPPIAEAQEYTIYLVPADDEEQENVYNEYLVINGAFQLIGSTAVDLSQYVQKSGFTQVSGQQFTIKNTNNQNVFNVHGYGGYLGSGNSTTGQGGAVSIGTNNSAGQYTVSIGKNNSANVNNGNNELFGEGNKTTTTNHTILGRYNEDSLSGVNVCISNGNSDNDRANAILFKTDKTITVKQNTSFQASCYFQNVEINTPGSNSNTYLLVWYSDKKGCTRISPTTITTGWSNTTSTNYGGLAVGYYAQAHGAYGCASIGTQISNSQANSLMVGYYNATATNYIFVCANGTSQARNNCFTVDNNGNVTADGVIVSAGQKINTLTSNSFTPVDNQVFKYTLSADTAFTIDTTALTANHQINFELHLKQGATAYTPSFTNTIVWGDGDVFDGSNTMPTMTDTNTTFVLVFRWDGEDLLCNLAYKKVVAQ